MTKRDLLTALNDLLQLAEALSDQVDDILSTPIEDMNELVKGRPAKYNVPRVKGLEDNSSELVDGIDQLMVDIQGEDLENE